MKKRPSGFLSSEVIDQNSEQFDYIRELHHYLWDVVSIAENKGFKVDSTHLNDNIDGAIEFLKK